MYLKRLELIGFKSFVTKTTFDFPDGVTGIVGPNGSGKSNIIDAIRWILGEREAKNIRAEKGENLIFSGTPQKTRASMAQVTITFDNSTKFFPVDFAEVVIRRKISRDGTSHYYLNEAEVRMRDIIDFFSKARMGTKGFSIINQGNSDLFIRATPAERRMMLEEVLGLRQYQLKRHEAENKLTTTGINLDKAKALVEELLPHLRLLRRQAGKWEKHDELANELKALEATYFGLKLAELTVDAEKIRPEMERIAGQIAVKDGELKVLTASLKAVEARQPQGDKHFDEFKKKQSDFLNRRSIIQKELGRLEAELEFMLSRPKASVKEVELLATIKEVRKTIAVALTLNDVEGIKGALKELSGKIDNVLDGGSREVANRQKEIDQLKKKFVDELEQLEKNLADLGTLEQKLAGEMREFNVVFKKAFEAVESKRAEITALETQKNRVAFDQERIKLRRDDLAHQAKQWGRNLDEFTAITAEQAGGMTVGEIERKMLKLRGDLASIGEIDPAMLKEAKEMEERYAFLSGQIADLEKAVTDLKRLIVELQEKIHTEFARALQAVNEEFNNHFRQMFNGGKAKLHLVKKEKPVVQVEEGEGAPTEVVAEEEKDDEYDEGGLEIDISIPRKNIRGLDLLSGGERSLVSIAVLFALITVSPPPFLVLDEVDAALDENNTKRFATLVQSFAEKTQFVIVTHNRATMSAAKVLYGITMGDDGTSRTLSLKLEQAEAIVTKA